MKRGKYPEGGMGVGPEQSLEIVLPLAHFRKRGDDIACMPDESLKLRIVSAQERVGALLRADRGGHGGNILRAFRLHAIGVGDKVRILRIDTEREGCVRCGILVGAVDDRVIGQCAKLAEAVPHLCSRAFEEASTAEREQRVAHKGQLLVGKVKHDVAECVARRLDHARTQASQVNRVAFVEDAVGRRAEAVTSSGPTTFAPVFVTISALPPAWSGCQCVFHTCVIFQPLASASDRIFAASGVSIVAVSPVAGSCSRKPLECI